MSKNVTIGIISAVILGSIVFVVLTKSNFRNDKPVACTEEAKICPDGSAVGRTGPQCQFASCPEITEAIFDKPITLNINQTITFPNNLSVTLREINDSRCKEGVQCIWEGELSSLFIISETLGGALTKEIRLGTVRGKTASSGSYTFALIGSTENSSTITVSGVSKKTSGYVAGHVSIGPICPVERVDSPCNVPPEVYTSRDVVVYEKNGVTIKTKIKLDAHGNYKISLGEGAYFVQISPAGFGPGEKKAVTVKAGKASTVDFDIDTGIR